MQISPALSNYRLPEILYDTKRNRYDILRYKTATYIHIGNYHNKLYIQRNPSFSHIPAQSLMEQYLLKG